MEVFVLDNYDSFTYNLVSILRSLGVTTLVRRNDRVAVDQLDRFDKFVLSPGPGIPAEAGIMPELLKRFSSTKSILGVCLGHQAIGECFGANLKQLARCVHGKVTPIYCTENSDSLFAGIERRFDVGRYHSWVVDPTTVPESLLITARDDAGEIMAVKHRDYSVRGVQFHPESIMTRVGKKILENWVSL